VLDRVAALAPPAFPVLFLSAMGLLAEFPGIPVIPLTGEGRGPGGACQPNVGQLGQFFPENPFIMVGGAARTARNRGMTAMPVWQTISVLALRPLVSGAAHAVGMSLADDAMDGVTKFLAERLGDPSRRLPRALERSTIQAWRSLEIALAGES